MAFAGADLTTPEGSFFFISASLRPGADIELVRKAILKQVERLATSAGPSGQAALIGRQLAASLTDVPDSEGMKGQVPPGMSVAILEGNLGLQAGMHAHRYGDHRALLAQQLADVSPRKVQGAARRHLPADKAAICAIRPAAPSGGKP